jgi:cell division protease FtsH
MENKDMFSNIIGYENVKKTLIRLIDIINNQEKYKMLGSEIPRGLFLYGSIGTGKTSISKDFLNNCNRKSYIIRKNKSDGEFINYLNEVFKEAEKNTPSVILLDDLDKFSENDHKSNNKEYIVVQSLIDEIKDKNKDIFVIATANDERVLPSSLLRSGRFDIKLKINNPTDKDSFEIIQYYLRNKKISKDVNYKNISFILNGSSCADLEKVCNQAGIYAGYNNQSEIRMEDLLKASLEFVYNTNIEDLDMSDAYTINTAYHEAAHALVGELLEENSVQFATTIKTDSNTKGMTKYFNNDNYFDDVEFMKNRIKTLLAGKAATEIVYNTCDTGTSMDIRRVFDIAKRFSQDYCMFGFDSWMHNGETSEKAKQNKDENLNRLISGYYHEVKELLIKNREKLDCLANELYTKKILFQDEIQAVIREVA